MAAAPRRKKIPINCRICGTEFRFHARPCRPGMLEAKLLPAIDRDMDPPRRKKARRAADAAAP